MKKVLLVVLFSVFFINCSAYHYTRSLTSSQDRPNTCRGSIIYPVVDLAAAAALFYIGVAHTESPTGDVLAFGSGAGFVSSSIVGYIGHEICKEVEETEEDYRY